MFSLICAWINGWVNTGEAGDLRRQRAHHDVTVMNYVELHIVNIIEAIIHDHVFNNCGQFDYKDRSV